MSRKKSSRQAADEEHTRGCCGCFGWFLRLFKTKKRGRRQEINENDNVMTVGEINEGKFAEEVNIDLCNSHDEAKCVKENGVEAAAEDVGEARQAEQDEETAEEEESKVVKTWAEEVDEAEEKGLDVFAPVSCLPHTATSYSDTEASTQNEATAATATNIKMSVTQRRRARRKALAAARKASTTAADTDDCDSAEQPQASDKTPVWLAPHVGVHGSDGRPLVPEAPAAAASHGGTNATRRRRARRKALTARAKSEARLAATTEEPPATDRVPVWPLSSVRVFGSDHVGGRRLRRLPRSSYNILSEAQTERRLTPPRVRPGAH
ncbi:hypothetical protein E2C01_087106 [Portunus trituberculatus]|uniref:Uncharacterized protein n=1 Tax=Portunus trituberculatus TaxID=210409 RepID=A0A5B7JD67_PORTR|nr:hypothetical protein [Portunus trituberculatus]